LTGHYLECAALSRPLWGRARAAQPESGGSNGDSSIAQEREDRRNDQISALRVRVIDENGEQAGIMLTRDAIARAEELSMDLVEVSPNAEPPVCKIMDYGKYVYQKDKAQHAAKKKQKQIQVKEIKFRPTTEKGDYDTKLRSAHSFIEEGDKVKVTVRYRGREMAHQELGMALMDRVRKDLEEIALVEQYPKMEGRQAVMVLSGKKR
jgi:translation initiation factor IF-3